MDEERGHELRFCDAVTGDGGEEGGAGERGGREENHGGGEDEGEREEFDDAGYWVDC
jgi:hypothetical protein